jgi:hypothetical protein
LSRLLCVLAVLANVAGWSLLDCPELSANPVTAVEQALADAASVCGHAAPAPAKSADASHCQHCLAAAGHAPVLLVPSPAVVAVADGLGQRLLPPAELVSTPPLALGIAEARAPPLRPQAV